MHACVFSRFSCVQLFATPWTVPCQAPLSIGFFRQECWSGLPCPPPGYLLDPGIKLKSPVTAALQVNSLPAEPSGKPWLESSIQLSSCLTLLDPMDCSTPGLPVHHQLLELAQTHVHWVSDAIQLSHPLSSPSPPTFNLSQHQGLFQWLSSLHQVAKYWSFSFSINPSNEYSELISFRIDWFDLLAVQGTLKSLLQHHSSKASILRCPAFFIVQLSSPYMTTGQAIALTRQTFVGKVMSLLFNMMSRLVIASRHHQIALGMIPSSEIC